MVGGLKDFLSKQEEVGEQEREDLVVWLRQVGSMFIPFIVLVCMYVCITYVLAKSLLHLNHLSISLPLIVDIVLQKKKLFFTLIRCVRRRTFRLRCSALPSTVWTGRHHC